MPSVGSRAATSGGEEGADGCAEGADSVVLKI